VQDSLFLVILLSGARILAARLPEPAGMAQLQLSLLRSSHTVTICLGEVLCTSVLKTPLIAEKELLGAL
jgi:hypothetical protein